MFFVQKIFNKLRDDIYEKLDTHKNRVNSLENKISYLESLLLDTCFYCNMRFPKEELKDTRKVALRRPIVICSGTSFYKNDEPIIVDVFRVAEIEHFRQQGYSEQQSIHICQKCLNEQKKNCSVIKHLVDKENENV